MYKGGVEMGGASWVCKCEKCGGRSIYTFPLGLLPVPLSWCACALIRGMLACFTKVKRSGCESFNQTQKSRAAHRCLCSGAHDGRGFLGCATPQVAYGGSRHCPVRARGLSPRGAGVSGTTLLCRIAASSSSPARIDPWGQEAVPPSQEIG
jgi:hypothetical protein